MKIIKLSTVVFTTFIAFISCQKQLDFGTGVVSVGTLKKNVTGDCLPVTVNGFFKVDSVLTNDNYVDVQVDVSGEGTFDIKSDTVNGYSFSKTGSVGKGLNTIRLYAGGKPLAAGANIFTIKYGASTCTFVITVTGAGTGVAVYSLGGSPGGCTGFIVNGTYTAGSILLPANSVSLQVNVISPGTYTISTNAANGISFSKTGTFSASGPQIVSINGTGTPTAGGNFNFTVTAGTNSCTFSLTVNGIITANIDYIPQTDFSNWSYRDVGGTATDTIYVHVLPGTKVINGNTYKIFETVNSILYPGQQLDSFYYRKNGGKYYHILNDTYYFDSGFNIDALWLDSSLATNANWIINLGSNTWGGQPATGSIKATILAKGATATIAGNNYNNIIKVEYLFRYNLGAGDVDYTRWELWYARGIGVIYNKDNYIPVTTIYEQEVTRVQVY